LCCLGAVDRIVEGFGQARDLGAEDFGDVGMNVGRGCRNLGQPFTQPATLQLQLVEPVEQGRLVAAVFDDGDHVLDFAPHVGQGAPVAVDR
jgi:hypothetical protein